jgi:hypothetical protein
VNLSRPVQRVRRILRLFHVHSFSYLKTYDAFVQPVAGIVRSVGKVLGSSLGPETPMTADPLNSPWQMQLFLRDASAISIHGTTRHVLAAALASGPAVASFTGRAPSPIRDRALPGPRVTRGQPAGH